MSENNSNYLVYSVLLVMLSVTAMSILKETKVEFVSSIRTNTGPHIWIPTERPKWETPGSDYLYIELRPIYNDYQVSLIESVKVLFVTETPMM